MDNSFLNLSSNDLEDIHMIAGDWQDFEYKVYTADGAPLNLSGATCEVLIFVYGDPTQLITTLSGTITGTNIFTASLSSVTSAPLSGVYQQLPRITFGGGKVYNPSQGKIYIFPSP